MDRTHTNGEEQDWKGGREEGDEDRRRVEEGKKESDGREGVTTARSGPRLLAQSRAQPRGG